MNFQNKRRKGLITTNIEVIGSNNVVPISISKMDLNFGGQIARFRRLQYKGCPTMYMTGNGIDFIEDNLVDMKRDAFIYQIYDVFKGYPSHSNTGYARFAFLARYFVHFDEKGKEVSLSEERVFEYYEYRESQVLRGEFNKNSLQKERSQLIAILTEMGNESLARKLPKIKNRRSAAIPTEALPDSDY